MQNLAQTLMLTRCLLSYLLLHHRHNLHRRPSFSQHVQVPQQEVVGEDDRDAPSALGHHLDTPLVPEAEEVGATHEPEYVPVVALAAWVAGDLVGDHGSVDDAQLRRDDNFHLLGVAPLLFFDPQHVAVHQRVSAPHDGLPKSCDGTALAEG